MQIFPIQYFEDRRSTLVARGVWEETVQFVKARKCILCIFAMRVLLAFKLQPINMNIDAEIVER